MSSGTNGTTAAADPLASFPQIPMANTMGAWLLGSVGATVFLNGLLFHQMYQYFREYSSDRRLLKVWVVSTVIFETFISALTLHIAYFYMVEKYWEPTYFFLQKPVWSFNLLPCTAPMAALVSQTFFVRRVWLFAPQFKIIVAIAFILNVSNVAFFAGLAVKLFESTSFTDGLRWSANTASSRFVLQWLASVGASMQMTGDIILTFTLIYVLRKSRTGVKGTDSMLEVLIAYAISTGALNSVVHILNVAFSIAWPSNFIYAALSCILTKLYANTFLVALNTRHSLNSSMVENETMNFRTLSALRARASHPSMPGLRHASAPTAIELKVHQEVTTDYDRDESDDAKEQIPSSMA
ncbi:hypothetical protein GSI_05583 [Ganoderma sinense ZZ0214-1]|uniref:DUF6534 domain-containing protein n=1 Tax=Ganoderma sinense ZZ0214-1 TaxID=1077348 RepID=A0A2G8SF61_9APHY|nr:hypothetical protein GSI_05583 [Ganoderma sinense ZZ0214-1]